MTANKFRDIFLPAALGWAGAMALSETVAFTAVAAGSGAAYTNSFTAFWLCLGSALLLCLVERWRRERAAKYSRTAGIFSVFLSLALVVGKELETAGNWNIFSLYGWLLTGILTLYFAPLVQAAWMWIRDRDRKNPSSVCRESVPAAAGEKKGNPAASGEHNGKAGRVVWARSWALIFLCWIPVFLAVYPGAFVYDAQDEYVQVATRVFTTHHPLAHVLLLGGAVAAGNKFFGSFNTGIALYTLCQMALLSGVLGWSVRWIRSRTGSKWGEILPVLFYGLFPVIPMYAVCSAKDGIFTAALLVVILQMLRLFEAPGEWLSKKRNGIAGILAAVAMMLFRNNGMYAYLAWAACALFVMAVCRWFAGDILRKMGVLMVAALLIYLTVSKAMAGVLYAAPGGKQELLTVPIQQMARVYAYAPETYSEEDLQTLYEILPEDALALYTPRISDLLKAQFNNENFTDAPARYVSLWLRTGLRSPMTYVNAWLLTSYGYWYPDSVINVYGGNTVHTYTYEDSSYFGFETEPPGSRESKFPLLEEFYRKLSLEIFQQKVPGLSMLFSPGFLFWVYAFCMGYLLWGRGTLKQEERKAEEAGCCPADVYLRRFLPLLLIFMLWLTVLLGPTYLVRYVLILWFALPVFVTALKI